MRYLKKKELKPSLLKRKCIAFKSSYQKLLGRMDPAYPFNQCLEPFNALRFKAKYDYIGYLILIGSYDLMRHLFSEKKLGAKRRSRLKKFRYKRSNRLKRSVLQDIAKVKLSQNAHSFFTHWNQVALAAKEIAANDKQMEIKQSSHKHSAPIIR